MTPRSETNTRLVLFDVSGVLLHLSGGPTTLLHDSADPWSKWSSSEAVRQFETGQTCVDQFVHTLIDELDLRQTPEEVYREFASWPDCIDPRAAGLVRYLRSEGYWVATLSNSNPIHWDDFKERLDGDLADLMTENFASHETGRLKPEPEAFEAVLTRFNCRPGEVVFFDDSPSNIGSASKLGINAFLVGGMDDVLKILSDLNIISDELSE